MTNPTLKELSEKAMEGRLTSTGPDPFGDFTLQLNGEGLAVAAVCNGSMWDMGGKFDAHCANADYICRLWNDHRSGSLVPVERVKELEKAAENLKNALRPFLFLFERDEFGREDDQLDGLPDAHGFEIVWETDDLDKTPVVTAGQVRRAREAVATLQALKGDS